MQTVFLSYKPEDCFYPDPSTDYSPIKKYPEYPYKDLDIKTGNNNIYDLVRNCLVISGYDKENYGTSEWNPLGKVINQGDLVLIKPNWVLDKNENKKYSDCMDCMVTNPSVLRAIIDYVVIALKGTGRIVVADAPMQGCNLEKLLENVGYNKLFEFYKKNNIQIEIVDMRKYSVSAVKRGVMSSPINNQKSTGSIIVDLKDRSMHSEKDYENPNYKVSEYRIKDTRNYHGYGKHQYEVSRISLEADVVINVPKPKTHRLAGMTAAVKNFVGITYEKACLPHRILGDKSHGGDAYYAPSKFKEIMQLCDEKRTDYSVDGKYIRATLFDYLMKGNYVIGSLFSGDKYRIGSWYGNDTIWRTSVDLNYILLHANKNGELRNEIQRKILTIADMIVCGQQNGPVSPKPKKLGMVMMAENCIVFDRVMCEIMGFSAQKLPMFSHVEVPEMFELKEDDLNNVFVNINGVKESLNEWETDTLWKFEPHTCWKGHIEK